MNLTSLVLIIVVSSYFSLLSGYDDVTPLFELAQLILLLLIPAVTMKSISDERKQGTIELLVTKPLSLSQIVTGKFLGALVLVVLALLPTVLYIFILNPYGNLEGNMDLVSTLGPYLGLMYLGFDQLAEVLKSSFVEKLGMNYHFKSMSRGVLDTRDLIYFVSITVFFLGATVFNLKNVRK